jgi:hypothetical protein
MAYPIRSVPDGDTNWGPDLRATIAGVNDHQTRITTLESGGGSGGGGNLNRVVAVNGVYPARPSTGYTDFLGIADPSAFMQTGDTWTQLPATVPNAPAIGTASGGNAQASVAFTAPSWNGGSAITGYTAKSTPGSITGTGTSSPITVTGLTNGTAYTFTVHATNSVGNSAESAASNSITPSAPTVPGAPTIGTATAGNASATVAFTPPASNGGSAITGYTATSTPGGITGTGSSSPIAVTGLTNGTAYTFTVHATNAIGNSAESAASNSVTPSASASSAVRFDASTDGLTYAGLGPDPSVTGYTVTFWAYMSVQQTADSCMFRYGGNNTSGTSTANIEASTSGVEPTVFTTGGTYHSGVTMSVGAWYRIAYTITTAGTGTFYVAAATGAPTVVSGPAGSTQRDLHSVGLSGDGSGEFWNGRMAYVRVWAATLTQAQIVSEWASTTPVVTSGLWAAWPLTSASDLTDHSGNGRNLTAGSTAVTTETPGPL